MKKILVSFLAAILYLGASAHGNHEHDNPNPNITPYHSASDERDGFNYKGLLTQPAWKAFQQKYPSWGARMNRYTGLPHRSFGKPIFFVPGNADPVAKAKAFLQQELEGFNLPINELKLISERNNGKLIFVDFKQIHDNKEILFSRATVRFTQDLRVTLFGLDIHRNISLPQISLSPQQAIQSAEQAISTQIISSEIASDLKILPVPVEGKYDYRQVYEVIVHTQDTDVQPGKYLTYVDATTGQVLYRQNKVVNIGFDVKADVFQTNLFGPMVNYPLKNLLVNVGGTNYHTDLQGNVVVPGAGPVNPTITLSGKYIKIVTGANGTVSPTFSPTGVNQGDIVNFPTSSPDATERHLTCYYHANEIHDFMKSKFPSFTAMDNPLTTRIDRTDGNCNAFYNGSSINFYTTSNGCNALSQVNTVVYHEYGHGITNVFWNDNGLNFDNGGMGEGYSDIWAISINKSPVVGEGFNVGSPTSFIRRYDVNPKVYPQDLVGQVHADGEIIAGAWYDFAVNLSNTLGISMSDAVDTMANIFAESHFGLANGADGTEGEVYYDILIDALEADDTDGDITNGTPHFNDLVNAFDKHGIRLLSSTQMDHTPGSLVNVATTVPVTVDVTADFPVFIGDVKMYYRIRGTTALDSLTLSKNNLQYTATFPGTSSPTIYEYYFDLMSNQGTYATSAPKEGRFSVTQSQRNIPYYMIIGYYNVLTENFENTLSSDWTVGNYAGDNATAGKWLVAVPVSSRTSAGDTVQTGNDHTSGTGKCAVTGNSSSANSQPGNADVDGGRTSLVTEEFDLSSYKSPAFTYWRWFSNSQGQNPRKDWWRVYASYNGGSWGLIERTYQPDISWRKYVFVPNLSQGTKVRLMFVATDSVIGTSGGSIVEAAVDDIEIIDVEAAASTNDINQLFADLYPNPTQQEINIRFNESGKLNWTLMNITGQTIAASNKQVIAYTPNKIDLSTLSNGVYLIKLELNGKQSIKKITIQ